MAHTITHPELLEILHYDVQSGVFTWRVRKPGMPIGSVAGATGANGYRYIAIKRKKYLAHRLAWFYVHGVWPRIIDHLDRVKSNNRLSNLRECKSQSENHENLGLSKANKTGATGVRYDPLHCPSRPYRADISKLGNHVYLGSYETLEQARDAYVSAKKMYHTSLPYLKE